MTEPDVTVFKPEVPGPDVLVTVSKPESEPYGGDAMLQQLMARAKPLGEAPPYEMMLIYGPPGAGKTKFCGEAEDVLIVDVEKGTETLLYWDSCRNATVMEFVSIMQIKLLCDAIKQGKLPQFKVLVIDSGTVLQKKDLRQIVRAETAKSSKRDNPLVPELQDYNQSTNSLMDIMDTLRETPIDVIVTATAKTVKDDNTGKVETTPGFTEKLFNDLNHLFSTIGYMSVNSAGERTLRVKSSSNIVAKTRKKELPEVILNPNVNHLLSLSRKIAS